MLASLELMWKGMVSIFVVIGAIFIVTFVITHRKSKKAQSTQETDEGSTGTAK